MRTIRHLSSSDDEKCQPRYYEAGMILWDRRFIERTRLNDRIKWVVECIHCGKRQLFSTRLKNRVCSCKKGKAPQLYNRYKYKAAKRGIEWSLSVKDFYLLTQGDCFYCGAPPNQTARETKEIYNGVDRIDSSNGYYIDNCVSCCSVCNRMKSDRIQIDFIKHCQEIFSHSIEKEALNEA